MRFLPIYHKAQGLQEMESDLKVAHAFFFRLADHENIVEVKYGPNSSRPEKSHNGFGDHRKDKRSRAKTERNYKKLKYKAMRTKLMIRKKGRHGFLN